MFILKFINDWEIFWEGKELLSFVGFITLVMISVIISKVKGVIGGSGCTKEKK